jgi:hypothetical protein
MSTVPLVVLTAVLTVGCMGGFILSGAFDRVERAFKGGGYFTAYTITLAACMVLRLLTDDTPLGANDASAALVIAGFAVHRLGKDRGWDVPFNRAVPGGWSALAILAGGVLAVVTRLVHPLPWRPFWDPASAVLIVGCAAFVVWDAYRSQPKDKE